MKPLTIPLSPEGLSASKLIKYNLRRLSDLKDHYADKEVVQQILQTGDPIIYEYWEYEYAADGRGLSFGMTRTYPGKIGREYHQTRGHFHADGQGDEIYIVLKGQGLLLLYSKSGEEQEMSMTPGNLYYIPGTMAHRTVNVGSEEFVFAAIWPPKIDHDYGTVTQNGFPKLVVEGQDGADIVSNPAFNLYLTSNGK
jgi:glucose-6-phosphate isomerase